MQAVDAFLDYAQREYGLVFPSDIEVDGKQHRYAMPGDKGSATSGFVTFHLDDNPMAVFGCWREYGGQCFKWFYRDQKELSKKERSEFKKRMHRAKVASVAEDKEKKRTAAVKAGDLWIKPGVDLVSYPYLVKKRVGAYGVKFYPNALAFDYFASDQRKAARDAGQIQIYDGYVMVIPVQNQAGQLVSLQQISPNGKFKGFLPGGMKRGCFHVIHGDPRIVIVVEGYATGASLYELTGATIYIAFDCGNLESVALAVSALHPDAIKIIGSDDDRFTTDPIENPGQTKAKAICDKTDFHNLKPRFFEGERGTDWNDLTFVRSQTQIRQEISRFLETIIRSTK